MTSNIEEAWRYLRMHQKWHGRPGSGAGFAGRRSPSLTNAGGTAGRFHQTCRLSYLPDL